jgi:DNA primase
MTGRLVTQEYHVQGPVMILLTTTAIDIDDELLNRCIVLTVSEDEAQTQAIHDLQRDSETFEGAMRRREGASAARRRHQNAQRLLRPLLVTNPFAKSLTFISNQTRTRRDHAKYLALIRTVALLRQYQRPVKEGVYAGERVQYIEATPDDIAVANGLARDVLGRSLKDLPPQTYRLLQLITEMVDAACQRESLERWEYRFQRRDVRSHTRWSDTPLKVHMSRLVDLEYLSVLSAGRGMSYVYRLTYAGEGADGGNFLPGLIDPESLVTKSVAASAAVAMPLAVASVR